MAENKWTDGPWEWMGSELGGVILATVHSGRRFVMGFKRYGMQWAQPTFQVDGRMVPASELVAFDVGDGSARGFKNAHDDASVYRYDVSFIDHPDARLIAAAPELAEALAQVEFLLEHNPNIEDIDIGRIVRRDYWPAMRAALRKARGEEGGKA